MGHIKHWGLRYDAVEEHICAEQGCMRAAIEFDRGQPKCARHLTLRMEVSSGQNRQLPDLRRLRITG